MINFDRLARSLSETKEVADEFTRREVEFSIGVPIDDPSDPVGRDLFNVLTKVAEFKAELIRARTRADMAVAMAKCRLRGKRSKRHTETRTATELAEFISVARSTVSRNTKCAGEAAG